jgi:hypothetical protein
MLSITTTNSCAAFVLPVITAIATLVALFGSAAVSPQAFLSGILINIIQVLTVLRIGQALVEMTLVSFLFQLSLVCDYGSFTDIDINTLILAIGSFNGRCILVTILSYRRNPSISSRKRDHRWHSIPPYMSYNTKLPTKSPFLPICIRLGSVGFNSTRIPSSTLFEHRLSGPHSGRNLFHNDSIPFFYTT